MRSRRINHDASHGLTGTLFAPKSEWVAPKCFPNLDGVKLIGCDIESRDPDLTTRGPGFLRGNAEVVGASIATVDQAWYFPFGHLGGGNLDRDGCISWLRHTLKDSDRTIVGANLQYELEGLDSLDIPIQGKLIDVQVAEALIDEESAKGYSLEVLCNKYLGGGKDETLLREASAAYGLNPKASLWKMPAKYVGPYGEYDAMAPIKIFQEQLKAIDREKLQEILTLECKLLPILWLMRKRGITVDVEKAESLSRQLTKEEERLRHEMKRKWGADVEEYSGGQLAMICDRHKILYPRTKHGNPSFTEDFLEGANHPFFDDLSELRELVGMGSKFVRGWLLKNHVNGVVHPQWRQLASDEGGTRTGRMAAANPNPQQIPAGKYRKTGKPNEWGKLIRSCFIPHQRGLRWSKNDYDQQEPRILVHFAESVGCTGAAEAASRYRASRDFDLYDLFCEASGLARRPTKDCYLGRSYGMGIKKLAYKFNKTEAEAKEILRKFDEAAPYVKEIADRCSMRASERGFIRTLLGRRRHFNYWEPRDAYNRKKEGELITPVHGLEEAQRCWPNTHLQRANTHKALNSLIQGSAADMTKAAMVKQFELTGEYPYMQVHDELNHGVEDGAHAKRLQETIESSVTMTVPVVSDMELGDHWK